MRVPSALALALALAACGAQPAPEFFGAARHEATVSGRAYTVLRKGARVQVIRHGWAAPGEHRAIRATMIGLIEPLTGCRPAPRSVEGDSGALRATVRC
jgi:hypothetical protein